MFERVKSLAAYYIKPNSLTWWSGVLAMALGAALTVSPETYALSVFSDVFAGLNGISSDPAQLIIMGLGLLGIGARKGTSN